MRVLLWLALGAVLAAAFVAAAQKTGPRNERRWLAAGLTIAPLIYAGFAVAGNAGPGWLAIEGAGVAIFGGMAAYGLRRSARWLAAGWALHTVWDAGLHLAGGGTAFAPTWYVIACIGFDLLVAGAIVLRTR